MFRVLSLDAGSAVCGRVGAVATMCFNRLLKVALVCAFVGYARLSRGVAGGPALTIAGRGGHLAPCYRAHLYCRRRVVVVFAVVVVVHVAVVLVLILLYWARLLPLPTEHGGGVGASGVRARLLPLPTEHGGGVGARGVCQGN